MSLNDKPIPNTKGIASHYWDALKDDRLLIQKCDQCARNVFYPRIVCPYCSSPKLTYKEHEGNGEIYSYTVVHKTRYPGFKDEVPYVVALIDLEGGGRMMSNIIKSDTSKIEIGSKVKVHFTKVNEELTLPNFILI